MKAEPQHTRLRYLDAAHVVHPTGTLAGVEVRTQNAERLGWLGGVLLEPARRKVRYFVVERLSFLRRDRYLVPADRGATLDAENRMIEIDLNHRALRRFDPATVPLFTDDDLLNALFAPSAA
jgi:hypothetical protein